MNTTKKLYLILLIVVISVVLWYAISLPKNQVQPGDNKPAEVVNNATTTEQTVATSTKDWLTYRNEEYGFEMKYPKEFNFETRPTIEKALFFDVYPIGSHGNDKFISLLVGELNVFIINAIESERKSPYFKGSNDNYTYYIYREDDNRFLRNDVIIRNKKKYNFTLMINGLSDLSAESSLNSFIKNEFNPQDQYLINILDQIKASMIFY